MSDEWADKCRKARSWKASAWVRWLSKMCDFCGSWTQGLCSNFQKSWGSAWCSFLFLFLFLFSPLWGRGAVLMCGTCCNLMAHGDTAESCQVQTLTDCSVSAGGAPQQLLRLQAACPQGHEHGRCCQVFPACQLRHPIIASINLAILFKFGDYFAYLCNC